MSTSRKPLLIAGLGARGHAPAIRAFIRSRRVPAMVTYKAKGVVADRDAWFAGVFTNGALEQAIVREADLLIAVGLDRVELLPRPWSPRQPIVDIDGDVADALARIGAELPPSGWEFDALQRTMEAQRFGLERSADASRADVRTDALSPAAVVRIASAALPDARVTVDAGAHMFPATLLWPVDEPGGLLISNGLSTMGFAVPAAIGAAIADPARIVVALTGDGGLLMCLGELATLVRERLRVVVIVFDDRSLSLIDVKQRQRGFAQQGVGVGGVAWDEVARAFGLHAHVAATAPELERALAHARDAAGPALIDARIDPAPYEEMLRLVRGSPR
ncbi:MAG TPA: thiamine pyrophosphate-dependent enzyme [Vicinamibacterales bacterium]|nr:thiamine pyrophosphate-dependent enzyme [Vicinamibacterales bacterium]